MSRPYSALYVHVPFCSSRCAYCAFYSLDEHDAALRRAYLSRLKQELESHAQQCGPIGSVYVGGGTPSVLEPAELESLLGAVNGTFALAPGAEFTVECNPESLTAEKAALMAAFGVNRVSLGVQTFSRRLRETLGRAGSPEAAERAVGLLREAGIHNLGVDLIYAIPGQSLADARADLERALAMPISHLSTYELTVEEGTRLAGSGAAPVDEETAVKMWRQAGMLAARAGIKRYEVSNLARPGYRCRHNLHVWHGGTYLGCGPAAASFDGRVRRTNPADLRAWLDGAPPAEDPLDPQARAREILALGLRTTGGWTRELFAERTGFDFVALCGAALEELASAGLLELTDSAVRPTERGLLLADYVARALL